MFTHSRRLLAGVILFILILSNGCLLFQQSTPAAATSTAIANLPTAAVTATSLPTEAPQLIKGCFSNSNIKTTQDSLGDPYFPELGNGGYDVQHYTLDIQADVNMNTIQGKATMEIKALQALDVFNMDFLGLQVDQVTVNGQTAQVNRNGLEMQITPVKAIQKGADFEVVVSYSGKPQPIDPGVGMTLGWNKYGGGIYVASEPAGASTWYPVNDHPCDKASYSLHITVPKPYEVAANGLLKQVQESGSLRTYSFEEIYPVASYLVTVDISQFAEQKQVSAGGVPVRNYFEESLQSLGEQHFKATPQMIDYFSSIYGPYPFETYGVVVITAPIGFALETQTMSLFGQGDLTNPGRGEQVVAHELSHQWFGDSVSLSSWKDIWLNEGFATFSQWMWVEHTQGTADLQQQVKLWYSRMASDPTHPGDPKPDNLFGGSVYFRGALTLYALRLKLGDEVFFKMMRTYYDTYKYGNATTQEFIQTAEQVSGQDLADFFQGWLYEDKMPPIPELGLKPE